MVKSVTENSVGVDTPPLLTVAMPIFNAGHHLRLAVLSIINQSFKDWELLIFDDGSTDNSVQSLADIDDPRIHILNDYLNKGLAARLNEAIDMARGQYFARMDQDDVSYPERFSKQLALLHSNLDLDVVATSAITISDDNEMTGLLPCPVSHEAICARPWQGFCFAHPTWIGKTVWFRKFKYKIPGPYFCEDQELLLRSYRESKFGATKESLFAYRIRDTKNLSRTLKTRWTFFQIQIRFFAQSRQFLYVIPSSFVYLILIIRDLWWELRSKIFSLERKKKITPTKEWFEWQKIRGKF